MGRYSYLDIILLVHDVCTCALLFSYTLFVLNKFLVSLLGVGAFLLILIRNNLTLLLI